MKKMRLAKWAAAALFFCSAVWAGVQVDTFRQDIKAVYVKGKGYVRDHVGEVKPSDFDPGRYMPRRGGSEDKRIHIRAGDDTSVNGALGTPDAGLYGTVSSSSTSVDINTSGSGSRILGIYLNFKVGNKNFIDPAHQFYFRFQKFSRYEILNHTMGAIRMADFPTGSLDLSHVVNRADSYTERMFRGLAREATFQGFYITKPLKNISISVYRKYVECDRDTMEICTPYPLLYGHYSNGRLIGERWIGVRVNDRETVKLNLKRGDVLVHALDYDRKHPMNIRSLKFINPKNTNDPNWNGANRTVIISN